MADNTVTVSGNVTRDPELRFTPGGAPVASFGIAVNRRWQNRQTQAWEEATSFFDVDAWRELAENVKESIEKGTRVIVTGRLEQESWEKDGEKRSRVKIVADEVGPSLRWATAEVTKNEREDDSGSGSPRGSVRSAGRSSTRRTNDEDDELGSEPPASRRASRGSGESSSTSSSSGSYGARRRGKRGSTAA